MALPHSPPSDNEDMRMFREFAEILDENEAFENLDTKTLSEDKSQAKCVFPSVAERFMGMKATIIIDNLSLKSFRVMLGFKVLQWKELRNKIPSEFLKLLRYQESMLLETGFFDLVFIHVEAGKNVDRLKGIEPLNYLIGDWLEVVQPETDLGSRLHISVIMSYGDTLGDDNFELSIPCNKSKNECEFSSLFPSQSYMVKGGKPRENIRQHCPMLFAQYQSAVTRVDMIKSFSFRDFTENGVNLIILADRFLYEVAFKLWKAPKCRA